MKRRPNSSDKIIPFPRRAGKDIAPRLILHLARQIDEAQEQGLDTPAKRRAYIIARAKALIARDRRAIG